jgi:tRNA A-37 threonylcarbamoyl transferase component Bud32
MNHLPWRVYFLGQKEFVDRTQKPLETIGNFISTMHSQGIAHEDLQLKNIGKDQTNQFIIFDVENSIVNDEDKIDDGDFIDYVGEDIRTFLKSLVDKGFLYDSTEAIFLNAVENYFLTPYLENLKINNDHLLTLIGHAIDTCLEDRSVKNHRI